MSVKTILFRRSGIRNMLRRLESTASPFVRRPSAVGEVVALRRRAAVAPRLGQDLDSTAGLGDGAFGGLGEGVGLDGDLAGQRSPAEDLHERALVGEPVAVQHAGIDGALVEALEDVE